MPPFSKYGFLYVILSFSVLILIAATFHAATAEEFPPQGWIFLAGAFVAVLTLVASSWTQWQTARTQHTLTILQTLRTDREYLAAAAKLMKEIPKFGKPMPAITYAELAAAETSVDPSRPDLRSAVYFVLNQYEFIAAAARMGTMDLKFLHRTIRGAVIKLACTFEELIRDLRKTAPSSFDNFVWLYAELRDGEGIDPAKLLWDENPSKTRLRARQSAPPEDHLTR